MGNADHFINQFFELFSLQQIHFFKKILPMQIGSVKLQNKCMRVYDTVHIYMVLKFGTFVLYYMIYYIWYHKYSNMYNLYISEDIYFDATDRGRLQGRTQDFILGRGLNKMCLVCASY